MENKLIFILACLFLPFINFAQIEDDEFGFAEDASKPTLFQALTSENNIPTVVLTTDIKRILKHKNSLNTVPSQLEYTVDGTTKTWNIDLSARGKSRRKICYMPPLKLEFSKKELKAEGVRRKYNTLKLVSYCKNQNSYEKFILKEYLAYKIYNILTNHSFNVQLVHLEYRDSLNRIKPVKRYGFLIENTDELAKRLESKEKNRYQVIRDSTDAFQHDVFALYQYMISNSDWKLGGLHNIKIVRHKKTKKYAPIPYDFDYSGFVNASYSAPNIDIGQTHVRERIYMGSCKDSKAFEPVRSHFIDKKSEIYDVVQSFELLDKKTRKSSLKFLKSFYKVMENEKKFRKKCLARGKVWE